MFYLITPQSIGIKKWKQLKKSSATWNKAFYTLSGVLILYGLFRFIKMQRQKFPKPIKDDLNIYPTKLTLKEITDWIKLREGAPSTYPYPDGKLNNGTQLYSIGYGHQIQLNEAEELKGPIDQDKIQKLLEKDVENFRKLINQKVKVPINKNQQLALLSFSYNIGPSAFSTSTLLRKLNLGDYEGASKEFKKWRLSEGRVNQGLVNRRQYEENLFNKPVI